MIYYRIFTIAFLSFLAGIVLGANATLGTLVERLKKADKSKTNPHDRRFGPPMKVVPNSSVHPYDLPYPAPGLPTVAEINGPEICPECNGMKRAVAKEPGGPGVILPWDCSACKGTGLKKRD